MIIALIYFLTLRGSSTIQLADYAAATADCQTSIALNPSYEKAHSRLGLSLFFRGEYEAAIEAYNKSLELDPTNRASLSYLVKSKARLAEQQVVQEETKRKEEEDRERNRKRIDWMGQQRQYQQQQKQQEHAQRTPPRVAGDREASNQGDVEGNTSSGLTPNEMNDSNVDGPRNSSTLATIEEGLQAFDPFSTIDD
jgi:tetratricopeptide (TPR) repeat protein